MTLIGWAAGPEGSNLRRIGSSQTGFMTGISAAAVLRYYSHMEDCGMVMTGVIETNGTLKITAWEPTLFVNHRPFTAGSTHQCCAVIRLDVENWGKW